MNVKLRHVSDTKDIHGSQRWGSGNLALRIPSSDRRKLVLVRGLHPPASVIPQT